MSTPPSPPGTTEVVRAQSALVVAPHYDDEVLGCGGLVAQLVDAGAVVRTLFLTDGGGDAAGEVRQRYVARRRQEARAAAKVLGIAGSDELRLPDGRLDQHLDAAVRGLRRALLTLRPELLLVTSPLETSADHRAAFRAVHELLGAARPGGELEAAVRELRVLAYEVNHPLYPDLLVDVSAQVERLERAMGCYASQQERHDYLGARLGLARFRALTLPPAVRHVEAYRRLTVNDFVTRGPARLVAELGGAPERLEVHEGPRISVVVRTRDRPALLAEALASLAANSYRRAEVVLVNDGGAPPEVPGDFPLPVRRIDLAENQGRAAAANAGIAAASGDCLAFLDDDDLAEPEHLATLAALVAAPGVRVAYTDAAVGVYELGDGGWRCRERRLPYSRDFDPDLLLVDNYIPFNTLVIDRRAAAAAGELAVDLPFFEDWEFLIRLARLTPFHHLARVTCEYRQFRGGGHHVLGDAPRDRPDFLAMKARVIERHAAQLTPAVMARVVDRLRAETVREHEEAVRLLAERQEAAERHHRLTAELTSRDIHLKAVEEAQRQAVEEVQSLRRLEREQALAIAERDRTIGEQGEALRQTYAEIERLNALVRTMESTRAWRLHQKLQQWKS